jgi:hypothetical protein
MNKIQIIQAIEHAYESLKGTNLASKNLRREFAEKVADLLIQNKPEPVTVNIVQSTGKVEPPINTAEDRS